ncbi:DUF1488 family protein [Paraburkholderia sediminicola]|uniref:DUF1488 family protein n=1 Tax=Paraburkholderia sediminicola TaxID=458836 RepID=UPI0038BCE732
MNSRGSASTFLISQACRPMEKGIVFRMSQATGCSECSITCEALEVHLWLSPRADARHMLKTFEDARNRIVAVAGKKMRARPSNSVPTHPS